ncbi:Ribonuclease PH [hydrothermal vent metagenome]|uniref:Ribonuclease PH n=1 Tax=hydrothermal vent metagenome TaxID=652676 RepID=A0A3B1DKD4_9ZZZZ
MKRHDGRTANQLRKVKVTKNYIKHPEGCCLIEFGDTKVICTASVEEKVPPFLKGKGVGWVTAEYGMLPRSCNSRIKRDRTSNSGRSQEIQRLIGRSLRSVVDMSKLGERTVKIDCDVLQGDGGTRTASITGGFIALALAFKYMKKEKMIEHIPLTDFVAAISVGIFDGNSILDLDYVEDSQAQTDMNVVMVSGGKFVEVQGTAEGAPFSKKEMDTLLVLAKKGIEELFVLQRKVIGKI